MLVLGSRIQQRRIYQSQSVFPCIFAVSPYPSDLDSSFMGMKKSTTRPTPASFLETYLTSLSLLSSMKVVSTILIFPTSPSKTTSHFDIHSTSSQIRVAAHLAQSGDHREQQRHRILIRVGLRTVRGDLFILLARCGGVSQPGKF